MPRNASRAARWSWTTGEKGQNRVRVFTHAKSGLLFLEWYEPQLVGRPKARTKALGHSDQSEAKRAAQELAVELLRSGVAAVSPSTGPLLLGALFDSFITAMQDIGSDRAIYRSVARRCVAFWGAQRTVLTLDEHEMARYTHARLQGKIVVDGEPLAKVRTRSVEEDLTTLRTVFRWAGRKRLPDGRPMLAQQPVLDWKIPKEKNPRRVMITEEEFHAMRAVADDIHPRFALALLLCYYTGYRINSVRHLRWSDIDTKRCVITWRAEHQKNGFEESRAIDEELSRIVVRYQRQLGGIGDAWVFPGKEERPMDRGGLYDWWRACRDLAQLPRTQGAGFHCFRRLFASALATESLGMVKVLGGWRHPQVVLDAYQRPSLEQQQEVLKRRRHFAAGA